jgi:pyruvate-formate lyase
MGNPNRNELDRVVEVAGITAVVPQGIGYRAVVDGDRSSAMLAHGADPAVRLRAACGSA